MNTDETELKIKIDVDEPVAIASNGSIGGVAFNIDVIAAKNPQLAEDIQRLYKEAKDLSPDDELQGHEEDIALISDMFQEQLEKSQRRPGDSN